MAQRMFMHWWECSARYESDFGDVLQREEGYLPNGNPIGGRWVLRNSKQEFIDVDQYRNDLVERHNIELGKDGVF